MITEQTETVEGVRPDTTLAQCQRTHHCRCGQELEHIGRDHCPRCGTALNH